MVSMPMTMPMITTSVIAVIIVMMVGMHGMIMVMMMSTEVASVCGMTIGNGTVVGCNNHALAMRCSLR